MKTTPSRQQEAPTPATALDLETPQPEVSEDQDAKDLLAEDPLGNLPLPPEIVSPRLAQLETWDAPAAESGYRVAPQAAEDEAGFAEVMVEEGSDEAEEERRDLQESEEQLIEKEEEKIEEDE